MWYTSNKGEDTIRAKFKNIGSTLYVFDSDGCSLTFSAQKCCLCRYQKS